MLLTQPLRTTAFVAAAALGAAAVHGQSLTIFHNNDGESRLLEAGDGEFGGFDYFLGELEQARSAAQTAGRDVLTISSGDNILPGLTFTASEARVGNQPAGSVDPFTQNYYDALALVAANYDAITLGNHEFDGGTDTLADFITGYQNAAAAAGQATAPFLSSNLDFSGDANLAPFTAGSTPAIAKSTIVNRGGNQYGIIGTTTPAITNISSPGGVTVLGDGSLQSVADAINAEVAVLQASGVENIILSGHLQGLNQDQALVPLLSGIDVVIAGGGDELLRQGEDRNTQETFGVDVDGPYPTISQELDKDGKKIALVTTQGEYRYVGEIQVEFDGNGTVTEVGGLTFNPVTGEFTGTRDGNPILVDPADMIVVGEDAQGNDILAPNPNQSPRATGVVNGIDIQGDIINPLQADVDAIAATVIGTTQVDLNGERGDIRSVETNLGNLVADAFLSLEDDVITENVAVALTNSGGIRASISAGEITVADVISVLPFNNSGVVIQDVEVATLVEALENSVASVSGLTGGSGRFLQIAGFSFIYDENNGEIVSVALEDGRTLYDKDLGVTYNGLLDIFTNSFTAGGGDSFDELADLSDQTVDLGTLYADVLAEYIQEDLNGLVGLAAYPLDGESRITAIPEPGTLVLLGMGGLAMLSKRRRAA